VTGFCMKKRKAFSALRLILSGSFWKSNFNLSVRRSLMHEDRS
jgi:hypothetical protein